MRESVAVKHSAEPKSSAEDVVHHFIRSVDAAKRSDQPYRNWSLTACLPEDTVVVAMDQMPGDVGDLLEPLPALEPRPKSSLPRAKP